MSIETRVTALEADVVRMNANLDAERKASAERHQQILALLAGDQPAKVASTTTKKVAPKAPKTTVRPSKFDRKWTSEENGELARWMRSKGLTANGAAWVAAKQGNRSVRSLKAIEKADKAA